VAPPLPPAFARQHQHQHPVSTNISRDQPVLLIRHCVATVTATCPGDCVGTSLPTRVLLTLPGRQTFALTQTGGRAVDQGAGRLCVATGEGLAGARPWYILPLLHGRHLHGPGFVGCSGGSSAGCGSRGDSRSAIGLQSKLLVCVIKATGWLPCNGKRSPSSRRWTADRPAPGQRGRVPCLAGRLRQRHPGRTLPGRHTRPRPAACSGARGGSQHTQWAAQVTNNTTLGHGPKHTHALNTQWGRRGARPPEGGAVRPPAPRQLLASFATHR